MNDYEKKRSSNIEHTEENPCLLIDPNRRFGLDRRHPFVQALLQKPTESLRALLSKEKENDEREQQKIANKETQQRLKKLGNLAGRFLRDQLDELSELGSGDSVDNDLFSKKGILIYPTYINIAVGNERVLTFYVNKHLLKTFNNPVEIISDSNDSIEILGSPFYLHEHKYKDDRMLGTFKIKGKKVTDTVMITAKCKDMPDSQALVQVIEPNIDPHDFIQPVEFERKNYRVQVGRRKKIKLFAMFPEVVSEEIEINVKTMDSKKVAVIGTCSIHPVIGTNYAEGDIVVEARTLKSKTEISVEINGRLASTQVEVIDKKEDTSRVPIKIEIRNKDFGNFRARWADHEGQPNLLLISAKHKSISRYLGPSPKFPGQDLPIFRVLIAEIVAESVCRKSLIMESKERPWDFNWSNLGSDDLIADDVLSKLQKRLREFLPEAHISMLSDSEYYNAS